MKKALLVLPVILAAIAFAPTAAPADENAFGRCPDHYTPTPAFFSGEDRNGNGVICVKTKPNGDPILHDDPNGVPYECNGTGAMTNPNCFVFFDIVDDVVTDG
jgi:hypothetical protein